jgi:hypothetical protein
VIAIIALTLTIHVANVADVPPAVMRSAQEQVSRIFDGIGIEIAWSTDDHVLRGDQQALRLTLLPYETGALNGAGAVLGAAIPTRPGAGTAWVFYRRVEREADRHGVAVAPVLACAIAHELGHLLQRAPQHTAGGVMRQAWGRRDYIHAAGGRLQFTVEDADELGLRR